MIKLLGHYLADEKASESVENIMLIAGGLVLSLACVTFYTYQVNKGAQQGANEAQKALQEAYNS